VAAVALDALPKTVNRSGKRSDAALSVAVLTQGGAEWIAGRVYIDNLIGALGLLPAGERIAISQIAPYTSSRADLSESGAVLNAHWFAFRATDSFVDKLRGAQKGLSHGKWPRSLEAAVTRAKATVAFPALGSLGREFPVPWIGWIPDFQHKRLPHFFPEEEISRRDERFQGIVNDAWHIVVSSEDAHCDLKRWFPTDPSRISVLPFVSVMNGKWYEEEPATVAAKFDLPERFLIFPCQYWAHKNHGTVFEAIRILRDRDVSDICLVSTGRTNDYRNPNHFAKLQQFLRLHGLDAHVRILGLLPRNEEIQLLRRAVAVIQPSKFEGWSALVDDARALGKRIYVSDIPVHREQQPPNTAFFPLGDAEQLAKLVAKDWPDLKPGPDSKSESEARAQQHGRTLTFARAFLKILERTAATGFAGA
jgi:glycosyltransferase involved in cell wall biosynthesis